jgi:hypothetical protein
MKNAFEPVSIHINGRVENPVTLAAVIELAKAAQAQLERENPMGELLLFGLKKAGEKAGKKALEDKEMTANG